jgi:hypothetical protein
MPAERVCTRRVREILRLKQHAVRPCAERGVRQPVYSCRRPSTLARLGHGLLDGGASFFYAQTDFMLFEVGPQDSLYGASRSA